ncbi:MAG: hypothetical protein ABIH78_02020 [Candidatus Peregrinibacteria bacterium]
MADKYDYDTFLREKLSAQNRTFTSRKSSSLFVPKKRQAENFSLSRHQPKFAKSPE